MKLLVRQIAIGVALTPVVFLADTVTDHRLAAAAGFNVWGVGTDSCATYVQEYLADRRGAHRERLRLELSWLQGFLTAENGETVAGAVAHGAKYPRDFDILKTADVDALKLWVGNYCNAHPLNSITDAAIGLSKELIERSQTHR